MAAANFDIVIDQGSDYALEFVVKNNGVVVDLTGYSARAHLRPKKGSNTLTQAFTCTITDAVNGVVKMELSNSDSTALSPGYYYYDLEIYTAGDAIVNRLLEGKASLSAETTK